MAVRPFVFAVSEVWVSLVKLNEICGGEREGMCLRSEGLWASSPGGYRRTGKTILLRSNSRDQWSMFRTTNRFSWGFLDSTKVKLTTFNHSMLIIDSPKRAIFFFGTIISHFTRLMHLFSYYYNWSFRSLMLTSTQMTSIRLSVNIVKHFI